MFSKNERVVMMFDSYAKTALKNELKDRIKHRKTRLKRVSNFTELREFEVQRLKYWDEYEIERFNEVIKTSLFDAIIQDELLYKALLGLNKRDLEIIVLKYWGKLTDAEIGNVLSMSRKMINYYKNRSLKVLKQIIEEMENDD